MLVPVTVPIPLLMLRLVAPVTDQDRVLGSPWVMEAGLAVKEAITGFCTTVTVTCLLVLPPGPVAARVYVVVAVGV